ncbi:MAG: exosortase/archaeosortase family protein, partial [Planctomycetota bacterium]
VQAFLLLMFPLPTRVHAAVAAPLQQAASALGAFGLELLGVYVRRDGNVLQLDGGVSVMVAEACSGLRMLTAFVFTAAVLVLVIRRPAWQKLVLLVASLPIAVLANAVRVLATSLIVHHGRDAALEHQVHDVAGVLMMPLALLMLLGVLKFLDQLAAAPRTRRPGAMRSFALPQVGARGAGRRPVFGNKVTR